MHRSSNAMRGIAFVVALGALLGACTSQYFDRRETIALSAGDAMASNRVTHMVDPWPAASASRDIRFDGKKMQGAVERYRNNQVTPPNSSGTSNIYQQQQQQNQTNAPVGSTVTQSAAPVK